MRFFNEEDEDKSLDPVTNMPIINAPVEDKVSLNAAAPMPSEGMSKEDMLRDQVRKNIMEKYGLGKFSPEERQKLVSQSESENSGIDWKAGLAALGAGLQGRSALDAGLGYKANRQKLSNQKLDNFDKNRALALGNIEASQKLKGFEDEQVKLADENDPNSERSKMAQQFAASMGYKGDISKLTAAKFKEFSPELSKILAMKESRLSRADAREDRNLQRELARGEKQQVRDEKKQLMLTDIEDRRRNIEDNLTSLESMIKEDGTYELLGSHNADMDRKVEQIATDMAKLMDPQSVARSHEVDAIKKTLIQPNIMGTKNSTALEQLKNFRAEINKRAENAYKIRGGKDPGSSQMGNSNERPVSDDQDVAAIDDKISRLEAELAKRKKSVASR